MQFIHYFIKLLLKLLLRVFWMFPIDQNKIVLINELSFTYGDNLKYLCEYIKHEKPNKYKIIFPLANIRNEIIPDIISVKPMSITYFFHLLTSKIIITNAGGVSYLPLRSTQLCFSTWHGGGPYKKTGNAVCSNKFYTKELYLNKRNTKYILSSCKMFSDLEATTMLFSKQDCISTGMPRNDVFFKELPEIKEKVLKTYSIDRTKHLVLFAPTFRSSTTDFTSKKQYHITDLNFERLKNTLEMKFGGSWQIALRLHPKLKDVAINIPGVINCTLYPDMQELLYVADVIITDYSSLMWDFSLTYRPCFLYTDDLEQYEKERGFYMPSSKWPYPISHNNDELANNILTFNEEDYKSKVINHHLESGSYENGNACKMTLELIENFVKNNQ